MIISSLFSLSLVFQSLLVLSACLVAFIFYQLIILPLWRLQFYKKQGLSYIFFPLLGTIAREQAIEKRTKDIGTYYKELPRTNRDVRMQLSNLVNQADIMLFDPKLIKEFHTNQSYYKKGFLSKPQSALLGTGLFLAEGALWKNHRKILSNLFHFEFIREKVPLIVSTTRDLLGELAKTPMKKVNILQTIQKITGEIVGKIFFSDQMSHYTIKGEPLTISLAKLSSISTSLAFKNPFVFFMITTGLNPEWVPAYKAAMKEIKEFREICFKIVQDRKKSSTKVYDLLGLLLETQKAPNVDDQFSDEDIVNEFITFFVAGMDSTAHLVTMTLYLLQKHPQYIEKIQKEVASIYDKSDSPSIEAISQMEVTHAIIKETQRLYNPAPGVIPRVAQVDHNLGDIKIKKGTIVRTLPFYNCFNPKYFDDPDSFYPERWLEKKENTLDPFIFIPFSAGSRNCIGQNLAIIDSKVIIAEFIKKFRFECVPKDFVPTMTVDALYGPKDAILMDLYQR